MERFSFDQLIGFLVFLIVALSQVWTSIRERKKQKKQLPQQKPVTTHQQEPVFEKPLQDLLEALGLPPQKTAPLPPPIKPLEPKSPLPKPQKVFTKPFVSTQKQIEKEKPLLRLDEPLLEIKPLSKVIKPASYAKSNHWQNLLKDRNQIQQAILMNEILGKPKGLTYFGS